jgi:hypothetical protein
MQNLYIAATAATPEIDFRFDSHHLALKGESFPENAHAFYGPVLASVRNYLAHQEPAAIKLDVQLTYFNSSSTKILLELFDTFNRAALAGTDVTLNWHYDIEDDTILEFGQEIAEDCPSLALHTVELN